MKGVLTKIEHIFLNLWSGQLGNFYLGVGNIWLALKCPESTATDGVLFAEVDVVF